MNKAIQQFAHLLQQAFETIFGIILYVWNWSFGQIIAIFHSNWQSLPVWKLIILAIVIIAIAFMLYKSVVRLWKAAGDIIQAFIALVVVLVNLLPYVAIAGLVAAAGGYVIMNVHF